MRRLALLLTICLGCGGPPPPTLQEQYAAAVGEFDREKAKLTQMGLSAGNAELRALLVYQFLQLSESRPFPIPSPRARASNESPSAALMLGMHYYYEVLPQTIAARKQSKVVDEYREQAQQAHDAWMDAVRPPLNSNAKSPATSIIPGFQ